MQYILLNSSKSINEIIKTTEDIQEVLENLKDCTHIIRKFNNGGTIIQPLDEFLNDLLCEQQVYAVMMSCMLSHSRKFKFIAKNEYFETELDIKFTDAREIWREICRNLVKYHTANRMNDLEYFLYSYTEDFDKKKALCFPLNITYQILAQFSLEKLNEILGVTDD